MNPTQKQFSLNVSNSATMGEYGVIRARFKEIAAIRDPKHLLAQTVCVRHNDKKKGGLGLMRLAAESKFQLSPQYAEGLLVIRAYLSLSMEGLV